MTIILAVTDIWSPVNLGTSELYWQVPSASAFATGRGVMYCGLETSDDLATPPGYGDYWTQFLDKDFDLPAGARLEPPRVARLAEAVARHPGDLPEADARRTGPLRVDRAAPIDRDPSSAPQFCDVRCSARAACRV